MVLQTCFSDIFGKALESFVDKLEGVCRPLELVPADFLKHSVELSLKRFFREVSTVRGSDLQAGLSLKTPEQCAVFLTGLFDKLALDLSDYPVMVMRDAYFRLRSRPSASSALEKAPAKKEGSGTKAERPATAAVTPSSNKKAVSSRPCVGHLAKELGAVQQEGGQLSAMRRASGKRVGSCE